MPLASWLALYGAVQSLRMEELVQNLGIAHPKNPRQLQTQLRKAARDVMQPKRDLVRDPARLREWARHIGAAVSDVSRSEEQE